MKLSQRPRSWSLSHPPCPAHHTASPSRLPFLTSCSLSSVLPLLGVSFHPSSCLHCNSKVGAKREGVRHKNHELLSQRDEPHPVMESRKKFRESSSIKTRTQSFLEVSPVPCRCALPSDSPIHMKDFWGSPLLCLWFQKTAGLEISRPTQVWLSFGVPSC